MLVWKIWRSALVKKKTYFLCHYKNIFYYQICHVLKIWEEKLEIFSHFQQLDILIKGPDEEVWDWRISI